MVGSQMWRAAAASASAAILSDGGVGGGGSRYITHVYRGSVFFTSIGQIRFVKTLLRLTYEAVVNGNRISVIGHPIIPPVQTRGEQRAEGLRRTPGTERSCGSSESVAFFERVKA